MIRNSDKPAVTEQVNGDFVITIPKDIALKARLYDQFELTYVTSRGSIKRFIGEGGADKATYDFDGDGTCGAILLTF